MLSDAELSAKIKEWYPTLLEIISKLVKTPSVETVDTFDPITQQIKTIAKQLDLPIQSLRSDEYDQGLYIGDLTQPTSTIFGVIGTADLGSHSYDQGNPFLPVEKDGKIYGAGVWRNTPVAMNLIIHKILSECGYSNFKTILLGRTAAKFTGIKELSQLGFQTDHLIRIGQGTVKNNSLYMFMGVRGIVRLKFSVVGKSVHSGSVEWQNRTVGANALEGAMQLWNKLRDIVPDYHEDQFPEGPTNVQSLMSINGGNEYSVIPSLATFSVEMRNGFRYDQEEYLQHINKIISEFELETQFKASYIITEQIEPHKNSVTPFQEEYTKYISEFGTWDIKNVHCNYLTPSSRMREIGVSNISILPIVLGGNQQTAEEYIEIRDMDNFLLAFLKTFIHSIS